jgi:lipoprotein NlpD
MVMQKAWSWPMEGKVIRAYQPDMPGGKGIEIVGTLGQAVRAASLGEVVYSGSGLPGYGRLIIVKHSDNLLSAYGYLGRIFVKEGDKVEKGQSIAELGSSGENRPVLHFEIRQDGKPVNPLQFLPVDSTGKEA